MKFLLHGLILLTFITSCTVNKQITKQAKQLLADSAVRTGHTGISIYDPATGNYWYNYNATQYFIPASNTKLFTLYAGMKYLGDSLVAARVEEKWDGVNIYGSGDPTMLHQDYNYQPLYNYAKSIKNKKIVLLHNEDPAHFGGLKIYGRGWMWQDYDSEDMPERSFFPIYGNVCTIEIKSAQSLKIMPAYFKNYSWLNTADTIFSAIKRESAGNKFYITGAKKSSWHIPFKTTESFEVNKFDANIIAELLSDTLGYTVTQASAAFVQNKNLKTIHSQPSDSLFKPMMHRSDNFFAEQTLLMASNEFLGYMSDEKMIDTILKSSLQDVPQKPKWVDGSGLSRYNLFTPQSFVYILNKMKNDFGLQRLKIILPTGGEGTITSYYKKDSTFIFAKTGTLSNNCAFSGYLITAKGKLLIFSILNNNYITGATPVRRAVERFLQAIRQKF